MSHSRRRSGSLVLALLIFSATAAAQDADRQQDLKKLSIEELSQIDVTSASRRAEPLSRTAAAVSVLRPDDFRRSAATSLAEVLRLADAMDVGQVNASSWGITTRGFNISTANKLLVLIDGRSTYSPLFGGTFWDAQDVLFADLDRIEVIRGPGGTIWGANAVNGVVNVISKSAAETQGATAALIGGSNDYALASARYGGRAGANYYRVYGKYRHRGPQLFASGGSAGDAIAFGQGGFRVESPGDARTRWFVSGAAYRGSLDLPDRDDSSTAGGHVLTRVTRATGGSGQFALQAYYDRSDRMVPLQFDSSRDTGEVDAQQTVHRGRHRLVFGGTFRVSGARERGLAGFSFEPEERTSWTANSFIQDEFEVLPGRLFLIGGTKIGRNNFTGLEFQPNVRVRVQPSERQMGWAAVSRAVRLPTRFDTDLRVVVPGTGRVLLRGSEDFRAESVIAYEAGYRALPHPRASFDLAAFVNRYADMRSQEVRLSPTPHLVLENRLNARTGGVEVATTVQVMRDWRVHGSYAWLDKSLSLDAGSTDPSGGLAEGNDPSHLAMLRSYVDLPYRLAFDAVLRHVSARPAPVIEAYTELDARLGWTARRGWDLSLVGQNLLHASHLELSAGGPFQAFRRAVFLRSVWQF